MGNGSDGCSGIHVRPTMPYYISSRRHSSMENATPSSKPFMSPSKARNRRHIKRRGRWWVASVEGEAMECSSELRIQTVEADNLHRDDELSE